MYFYFHAVLHILYAYIMQTVTKYLQTAIKYLRFKLISAQNQNKKIRNYMWYSNVAYFRAVLWHFQNIEAHYQEP